MVKNYSESEGEKHTTAITWATLFNSQQEFFYMHHQGGKDALNTFYLCYMVKDHLERKRGNPLPPLHGLLFLISSKIYFICTILHTTTFVTPIVEHWFEEVLAQWVHHEESIWWPIALWVDALPWTYRDFSNTFTYIHLLMYLIHFY